MCNNTLNVRSSWDLNSPSVHEAKRGDVLHGHRVIQYSAHLRVELDDGTWTSMMAGRSLMMKTATQAELDAVPSERAQLAHISQVNHMVECDKRALEFRSELMDQRTKDMIVARISGNEQELQCLRERLAASRLMANRVADVAARSARPPRCFLPTTRLKTSDSTYTVASGLEVGDTVFSCSDERVLVIGKTVHDEDVHEVVELRTRGASLKVTSTHRIVVPSEDGLGERYAHELSQGDQVMVHKRPERLVKVLKHTQSTAIVELRFAPDEPVECFQADRWGVLTLGTRPSTSIPDTDDGFDD